MYGKYEPYDVGRNMEEAERDKVFLGQSTVSLRTHRQEETQLLSQHWTMYGQTY